MTGREAWVKMGLDLGADVYLACLLEVAAEKGIRQIPSDEMPELIAEVSRRFQKRWPPWKVEATKQEKLNLEANVPPGSYSSCDRCNSLVPVRNGRSVLHPTGIGNICTVCLGEYIQELNISKKGAL